MFKFTHNNHLKYYIDNRLYGTRQHALEEYRVEVGSIDHAHYRSSNWMQEQYRIAELVAQSVGPEFCIFYSGGSDSEIVMRMLQKIGRKPTVFFMRFKGDYNLADYNIAVEVTESLGLKLNVIDHDAIEFYKGGRAAELAAELQCSQLAYLNTYHHIIKLGMPAVMGGELMMRKKPSSAGSKWYYVCRENEDTSAMRLSLKYNIPLAYEWFTYTPEVIAYFIEHPIMQQLVADKYNYKVSTVSSKNAFLKQVFPELSGAPKLHGFERLMEFNTEAYHQLARLYSPRLTTCTDGIPLHKFRSMIYGDAYEGN